MQWTESATLALAKHRCSSCHGLGMELDPQGIPTQPCNCVMRSVFRHCYNRFQRCAQGQRPTPPIRLEHQAWGSRKSYTFGIKEAEFVADFCAIARRHLNTADHQLFKLHFLYGLDWRRCVPKLGLNRGTFFHAVYRIQEQLGRAFAETQPYALFPTDEYFAGTVRGRKAA